MMKSKMRIIEVYLLADRKDKKMSEDIIIIN